MLERTLKITKTWTADDGQTMEDSITYGPRQMGDKGLDILAVKIALGILVPNISSPSPEESSVSDQVENNVWFDCDTNTEVSTAKSVEFDKKMQIRLMEWQIANRKEIVRFLFTSIIHDYPLEGQVIAEDYLFDSIFGVLEEASLRVMHGWKTEKDIFYNPAYNRDSPVSAFIPRTQDNEEIDAVLSAPQDLPGNRVDRDIDGDGEIGEGEHKIKYVGPTGGGNWTDAKNIFKTDYVGNAMGDGIRNHLGFGEKEEEELPLAPRVELEQEVVQPYPEGYESVLSAATLMALKEKEDPEYQDVLSAEEEQEQERGAGIDIRPNPETNPNPFILSRDIIGCYIRTGYTISNPPVFSSDQEKQQAISRLESKALRRVLDFFGMAHMWHVSDTRLDELHGLFPAARNLSPSHDGRSPCIGAAGAPLTSWFLIYAPEGNIDDLEINYNSIEYYRDIESSEIPFIRFIDWYSPTSGRPGEEYRAYFQIYRHKLEFFATCEGYQIDSVSRSALGTNQRLADAQEDPRNRPEECEIEDSEVAQQKLQEYKQYVAKRKKEVSRRMRELAASRQYKQARQRVATRSGGGLNIDIGGGVDLSGEQQRGIGVLDEFGMQGDDTYFGTLSNLGVPRLQNDGFEYGDDLYSTNDVSWDPNNMVLTIDSKQVKSAITKAADVLKAGTEDINNTIFFVTGKNNERAKMGMPVNTAAAAASKKIKVTASQEATLLKSVLPALDKIFKNSKDWQELMNKNRWLHDSFNNLDDAMQTGKRAPDTYRAVYGIIDTRAIGTSYQIAFKFKASKNAFGSGGSDSPGYILESITIKDGERAIGVALTKDTPGCGPFFNASPLTRPRTMAYFAHCGKIASGEGTTVLPGYALGGGRACGLFGVNVIKVFELYTAPFFLKMDPKQDMVDMTKRAAGAIAQDAVDSTIKWFEEGMENLKSNSYMARPDYSVNELLPAFGPACSLDEIWDKFLAKFDLVSLICEYIKCIKLPEINLSFDFDLRMPPFPKLPTIDFLNFLRILLTEFLVEAILRMLCTMVNAILDLLKFPDCDKLFDENAFGMYDFDGLFDDFGNFPGATTPLSAQANIAQRALAQAMTDTGIPPEKLDKTKDLINAVFSVLTPAELCRLLKGEASESVTAAILTLIEKTMTDLDIELVEHFSDIDNLFYFFESLGVFLPPDICETLENVDVITGELTCREKYEAQVGLREALEKNENLTEEEIQELLDIAKRNAEQRLDSLNSALNGDSIADSLGPIFGIGNDKAAVSSLPASFKNALANAGNAIFDVAKAAYITDLASFVPSLYLEVSQIPQLTESTYDAEARIVMDEMLHKLFYFETLINAKPLVERKAIVGSHLNPEIENNSNRWTLFTIREFLNCTFERSYFNNAPGHRDYRKIISEGNYNQLSPAQKQAGNYIPFHMKRNIRNDQEGTIAQMITSRVAIENNKQLEGISPEFAPRILQQYWSDAGYNYGITYSANLINFGNKKFQLESFDIPIFQEQSDNKEPLGPFTITNYAELKDLLGTSARNPTLKSDGINSKYGETEDVENKLQGILTEQIGAALSRLQAESESSVRQATQTITRSELLPEIKPFFDNEIETIKNKYDADSLETTSMAQSIFLGGARLDGIEQAVDSFTTPGRDNEQRPTVGLKFQPLIATERYTEADSSNVLFLPMKISNPPTLVYYENVSRDRQLFTYTVEARDSSLLSIMPGEDSWFYTSCGDEVDLDLVPQDVVFPRRDTYAEIMFKNMENTIKRYNFPNNSNLQYTFRENARNAFYRSTLEHMFEYMLLSLHDSNVFDEEYVTSLEKRITGKKHYDRDKGCIINPSGLNSGALLSFSDLYEDLTKEVEKEFGKPENQPEYLDYASPGPIEKAFQNIIVKAMIRVFMVEYMLRSSIINAKFSPCYLKDDKFFDEFFIEFVRRQFETKIMFKNDQTKNNFFKVINRVAGFDPNQDLMRPRALKSIISQDKKYMIDISATLFKTDDPNYSRVYTDNIPILHVAPWANISGLPNPYSPCGPPGQRQQALHPDVVDVGFNLLWAQDIPDDYLINGGFFFERYIRLKTKLSSENSLVEGSRIVLREAIQERFRENMEENAEALEGVIENDDNSELSDDFTAATISMPTVVDDHPEQEVVSIEELEKYLENSVEQLFDNRIEEQLLQEIVQDLDLVGDDCSGGPSAPLTSRFPVEVEKTPTRLIKRNRTIVVLKNNLARKQTVENFENIFDSSVVYDSAKEGDTRYYVLPMNYCYGKDFSNPVTLGMGYLSETENMDPSTFLYNNLDNKPETQRHEARIYTALGGTDQTFHHHDRSFSRFIDYVIPDVPKSPYGVIRESVSEHGYHVAAMDTYERELIRSRNEFGGNVAYNPSNYLLPDHYQEQTDDYGTRPLDPSHLMPSAEEDPTGPFGIQVQSSYLARTLDEMQSIRRTADQRNADNMPLGLGQARGITMRRIRCENIPGFANPGLSFFPFDPAAPWFQEDINTTLTAGDELIVPIRLGQVEKEEFDYYLDTFADEHFSSLERPINNEFGDKVSYESWNEIVIDLVEEAAVPLYNPGESCHLVSEMPYLTFEQLRKIDFLMPSLNYSLTNSPRYWTHLNVWDAVSHRHEDENDDSWTSIEVNNQRLGAVATEIPISPFQICSPYNEMQGDWSYSHGHSTYGDSVYATTFVYSDGRGTAVNVCSPSEEVALISKKAPQYFSYDQQFSSNTTTTRFSEFEFYEGVYGINEIMNLENQHQVQKQRSSWDRIRLSRPLGYTPVESVGYNTYSHISDGRHQTTADYRGGSNRPPGREPFRNVVIGTPTKGDVAAAKLWTNFSYAGRVLNDGFNHRAYGGRPIGMTTTGQVAPYGTRTAGDLGVYSVSRGRSSRRYTTNKYYVPLRILITQIRHGKGSRIQGESTQTELETYVKIILPETMQARKEEENSTNEIRKQCLQRALDSIYQEYVTVLEGINEEARERFPPTHNGATQSTGLHHSNRIVISGLPSFAKTSYRNSFVKVAKQPGMTADQLNQLTSMTFVQNTEEGWPIYQSFVANAPSFCSVEKVYSIAADIEAKERLSRRWSHDQDDIDKLFLENPGILAKEMDIDFTKMQNSAYMSKPVEYRILKNGTEHDRNFRNNLDIKRLSSFPDFASSGYSKSRLAGAIAGRFCNTLYNIAAIWYGQRRYDSFWGDTSYRPWLCAKESSLANTYVASNGYIEKFIGGTIATPQNPFLAQAPGKIYQSVYELPSGPLLGTSPFYVDGRFSYAEFLARVANNKSAAPTIYEDGLYTKLGGGDSTSFSVPKLGSFYQFRMGAYSAETALNAFMSDENLDFDDAGVLLRSMAISDHGRTESSYEAGQLLLQRVDNDSAEDNATNLPVPNDLLEMWAFSRACGVKGEFDPIPENGFYKEFYNHGSTKEFICNLPSNLTKNIFQHFVFALRAYSQLMGIKSPTAASPWANNGAWFNIIERNSNQAFADILTQVENYRTTPYHRGNSALVVLPRKSGPMSLGAARGDYIRALTYLNFPKKHFKEMLYFARNVGYANLIRDRYWSLISNVITTIVDDTMREALSDVLNKIKAMFDNTEISFGMRLVQVIGGKRQKVDIDQLENRRGQIFNPMMARIFETMEGDDHKLKQLFTLAMEERSYLNYSKNEIIASNNGGNAMPHPVFTIPLIEYEEILDPECISYNNISNKYRQNSTSVALRESLINKPEYKALFEFIFPLDEFVSMVNVFTAMVLSSRVDLQNFMDPTKSALISIFEIMSNRNDFGLKDGPLDNIDAAAVLNSELFNQFINNATSEGPDMKCIEFPNMGNFLNALIEQIINIIKYTPSIILRGIASAIDPAYIEMKQHHFSCNPETHIKNLKWSAIKWSSERKKYKLNDGSTGCKGPDSFRYVPVIPGWFSDLGKTGFGFADLSGFGRAMAKFGTYVYNADIPFFKFDLQFDIPCLMDEPYEKDDKYGDFTGYGRYGHPLSPVTALALSTLELPTEKNPSRCERNQCSDDDTTPDPMTPAGPTTAAIRNSTDGGCPDIEDSDGNFTIC